MAEGAVLPSTLSQGQWGWGKGWSWGSGSGVEGCVILRRVLSWSRRGSGCDGGNGGRRHSGCGPGPAKLPQPGRSFPDPRGPCPLADRPSTPAAKLARCAGLHPHPAGPSSPCRPAQPLRLCHPLPSPRPPRPPLPPPHAFGAHSPSRGGVRACLQREGLRGWGKDSLCWGFDPPSRQWRGGGRGGTAGERRAWETAPLAGAWRQRPPHTHNLGQPRPGRAMAARG